MAKLTKTPAAQYPLTVAFRLKADDTMVNTSGTETAFGATSGTVFDICTPPAGAMVIGGRVIVKTVFSGSSGSTVDIGDSTDTDRYTETAAIDMADADAPSTGFDMLGDGYVYDGSEAIRLTITNTSTAATAGEVIVVVTMVITGRQNENLKTT